MSQANNPYVALLDQASERIKRAKSNAEAKKHRLIYLAIWPLAFAGLMQNSLAGGCLSDN